MNESLESPFLVALGVFNASLACYAAISLLGRVYRIRTNVRQLWLLAGAFILATGLWSMHGVGVLGLALPIDPSHAPRFAVQSWFFVFGTALVCFHLASRPVLTRARLLTGSVLAALGLCGMFYSGLRAVGVRPDMSDRPIGLAAIAIGFYLIATVGIWWAYRLRGRERLRGVGMTALASLAIGVALVVIQHAALRGIALTSEVTHSASEAWEGVVLAIMISASTLFLMALGVVTAALDRRLDRETSDLLASLRSSNARLEYNSRHDTLTGLPNRSNIYARIDALTRDSPAGTRGALMYIDIDGFKVINDSLGHTVGDRLLQHAAKALSELAGPRHLLGRIGGDEFLLLLENVDDTDTVDRLSKRIIERLETLREHGATLTASIGIARYPEDAADTTALVAAADMAMYEAKRAGKRRARWYLEQMGTQRAETFEVLQELRHGISNDEFIVYYQPKYDGKTLQLVGAEALVRWQNRRRGMVSPGLFIEVAERGGLINDIELCVLNTVCRHIRDWSDAGYRIPTISINLSVARLLDEHLITETRRVLERYHIAPYHLVFEITETLAMQEFDTALRVLNQLHELGIQLSLDDFGTGYSSLSYLQTLPIQQLKIDRSFIANLADDASQHNGIVKLIVDLAHLLDIQVIAEGIETSGQQDYLRRIGCDGLQGFLLDHPMPQEDFVQRLDRLFQPGGGGPGSSRMSCHRSVAV